MSDGNDDTNSRAAEHHISVPNSHRLQSNLIQLLTDKYAGQSVSYAVAKVLKALGNVPHPQRVFPSKRVYRARINLTDEEACDIDTFHAPQPVSAPLGRANLPAYPVFYGSFTPDACCMELSRNEHDPIWIAQFSTKKGVRLVARNYVAVEPNNKDLSDPRQNYIARQVDKILNNSRDNWRTENSRDELIASMDAAAQIFTSLNHDLSARAAHNVIWQHQKPEVALMYSSVGNPALINIAIHPLFASQQLNVERVCKCLWLKAKQRIRFLDVAYPDRSNTSRLCWQGGMPSGVLEELESELRNYKLYRTEKMSNPDGSESIFFDSAESIKEYVADKFTKRLAEYAGIASLILLNKSDVTALRFDYS